MTHLTLDQVDQDGALRETAAAAASDTRAGFLTRLGGGAFGAAALLAVSADTAGAQSRSDIAILNFALTLEYLEAAFYREAVRVGAVRGERRLFAQVAGGHERTHVAALRRALGSRAVKRPRFDFRDTTQDTAAFTTTAIALEETGTAAYKGQAPLIQSRAILAAALTIHSVEARHTAWIRDIAGLNPAPRGLDPPATRRQTLAAVRRTGFIVATRPSGPSGTRRPAFTG